MAETNEFFIKIGADVDDAMSKLNMLSNQLSSLANSTQRSGNIISGSMNDTSKVISAAFSQMGVALTTAGIVAAIFGIGKASLSTAAELEQIEVSFKVFTGSAETAKNMLAQLKEQALNSPMQFQDITKGAQTLLQYGLTAQQVTPITKMLGDISGGNADRFQRLSLAFGQVNAAGRLMGQEARQMINAGFNPLKAISDKTGESMATLTQRMHDGGITVQDVAMAFNSATSEGGQFFGMADEQAKTLGGLFNKLSESVMFALADIGQSLKSTFDIAGVVLILTNSIGILKESFKSFSFETNNSNVWANIFKGTVVGLTIALDLLIRTFKFLKIGAEEIIGTIGKRLGQVISFTSEKIFEVLKKDPMIGGGVVAVNDYFKNLINKATSANQGVKKTKTELEKLKEEYDKILKTFSNVSSKEGTSKKEKKSEAQKQYEKDLEEMKRAHEKFLEENYKRQEKLIDVEKNTLHELSTLNMADEEKALADLKKEFEEKKKIYEEGNKSTTNLELLYNEKKEKIQKEFAHRKAVQSIKDLHNELEGLKSEYKKGYKDFVDDFVTNFNKNKIENYTSAVASALQDFGVSIFSGFASIAGSALAGIMTFNDAIAKVGSMFLNLVGDLLIQMGTSAIKLGIGAESIQAVLETIGLPGGGAAAIAVGTLAVAAGSLLKGMASKTDSAISAKEGGTSVSVKSGNNTAMASGSSYAYGGSSYATQTMRLAIDLTGSITSTQTGYQINKSLETVLRVTGR